MYIRVKVKTETKREGLKEINLDHFEMFVKEPAERNLANKRVLELIAQHFCLSIGKVHLIKGHKNPTKLILLK